MELISRAAFNTGAVSSPENNLMWDLLNHLIGWAPIYFTYSFQLNRDPPFFFGLDPDSGDKKSNKDAHSIAVSPSGAVLYSFGPGEEVTIAPQGLLVMAGWEFNLATLLSGGEFAIAVNCYNDAHDLPALDWTNHTQFIPSTQTPLCLLTVEALRMSSINKQIDLATGTTTVNTILRFDTREGDSFFRLPSFSDLVLSLIQCIILLSVPTSLSIMFASTCLGSLSQIFKRTQIEMFFIGSKIPSMGLRLAKDAMALGQVSPEKEQIEIDALRTEMERILADLVSNSKLSELSQDMSDHILKHNQKNKKCDPCDEHEHPRDECDPCDLANLLSVGERAKIHDVVAYFDHSRQRGLFELAALPNSHRKDLKRWKKEKGQSAGRNSESPSAFVRMSSRISAMAGLQLETQNDEEGMEDKAPLEYTDEQKLERAKEDATFALEELKGEVKWMNDLNMQKKESNTLEKVQEKEKRLENRKADVQNLSQKLAVAKDLLNAKVASVKSHQKDLMQVLEKKERLERRFIDAVKRGKKLRFELHLFRERMSTDPVCPLPDPDEDSKGQYPHPALRQENEDIKSFDGRLRRLADNLFTTLYATGDGIGLAAPQVGINMRVMVYNPNPRTRDEETVFVNPRILSFGKEQDYEAEGCLSFPRIRGSVQRPTWVEVEARQGHCEGLDRKMLANVVAPPLF
eukprot:symbB.v1.2.002465.t2/scaffold99.1/size346285/21